MVFLTMLSYFIRYFCSFLRGQKNFTQTYSMSALKLLTGYVSHTTIDFVVMPVTGLTLAFFSLRSRTFCSSFLCFLVSGFLDNRGFTKSFFFFALLDGRTNALLSSTPFNLPSSSEGPGFNTNTEQPEIRVMPNLQFYPYLGSPPQHPSSPSQTAVESHFVVFLSSCAFFLLYPFLGFRIFFMLT